MISQKRFGSGFFSYFDPAEKTVKYQNGLLVVTALILLLFTFGLGVFSLYFAAGGYGAELFAYYFSRPSLIILNVLPYILFAFLVWFLSNRAWIGFLSSGILCLLYSFTEYWKLMIRSEPLFAEDLFLIGEAIKISDGYLFFTWQMMLAVLFVVVGALVLFLFCRGKFPKRSVRFISAAVLLVIGFPLYQFVYSSDDIYDSYPAWGDLDPWIEIDQYLSRGGVYPFLHSVKSAVTQPPEGYKQDHTVALLQSYETDMIPEDQKVNLVFVMFEAYADLSEETDMITGGDPYREYHQILSQSYHGDLVANFYGGGTNNTERSVMTGFSELYHFRHPLWSYVRYFSDNGYVTQGSHGGYQSFYNRNNVNANMGFDEYWFYENRYGEMAEEQIPRDYIFLPDITELALDRIRNGENVFSYNVTYQNHGPYNTTLNEGAVEYVPKGTLGDEDYAVINNYLNGIADTGIYMKNMVETFGQCDEPVILVMFGDHRPSMGDWGSTYENLGISMYDDTDESFYHFYRTEYVIWANDAAKSILNNEFKGEGPTISPCFLMNVLFDQCGWNGPSYMKLTDEVMAAVPVITINDRFLDGDALVRESELSPDAAAFLRNMRYAQFYLSEESLGILP